MQERTDSVLESISLVKMPRRPRFVKLDINEFYMCGRARDFANLSFTHLDVDRQQAFVALTTFILERQFVHVGLTGTTHKVLVGSGMGQICSGDLADMTFFNLCEKSWAATKAACQCFGIVWYGRYRDDILMLVDDDHAGWGWTRRACDARKGQRDLHHQVGRNLLGSMQPPGRRVLFPVQREA